jgi:hypothetical protein
MKFKNLILGSLFLAGIITSSPFPVIAADEGLSFNEASVSEILAANWTEEISLNKFLVDRLKKPGDYYSFDLAIGPLNPEATSGDETLYHFFAMIPDSDQLDIKVGSTIKTVFSISQANIGFDAGNAFTLTSTVTKVEKVGKAYLLCYPIFNAFNKYQNYITESTNVHIRSVTPAISFGSPTYVDVDYFLIVDAASGLITDRQRVSEQKIYYEAENWIMFTIEEVRWDKDNGLDLATYDLYQMSTSAKKLRENNISFLKFPNVQVNEIKEIKYYSTILEYYHFGLGRWNTTADMYVGTFNETVLSNQPASRNQAGPTKTHNGLIKSGVSYIVYEEQQHWFYETKRTYAMNNIQKLDDDSLAELSNKYVRDFYKTFKSDYQFALKLDYSFVRESIWWPGDPGNHSTENEVVVCSEITGLGFYEMTFVNENNVISTITLYGTEVGTTGVTMLVTPFKTPWQKIVEGLGAVTGSTLTTIGIIIAAALGIGGLVLLIKFITMLFPPKAAPANIHISTTKDALKRRQKRPKSARKKKR